MKTKKLQKAANGLQKIQADNTATRSLLNTGVSTAAEVALPGVGGAIASGLETLSSMTKDSNGLYKSKGAQVLDGLSPVTQLTRAGNVVGGLFSGKLFRDGLNFDVDGQRAIKDALAQQKLKQTQQATWDKAGLDTGSMSQVGQYKKGAKKVATKAIEIEGGEPHFSRKKNGKRTLKSYSPNGPTHEQGGIPVLAEEGDAIVTAKGNKGAQAVAAHQRGDHKTVEKLINQMPADKQQKKAAKGLRSADPRTLALQKKLNANGYQVGEDGVAGDHTNAAALDFAGMNKPMELRNLLASTPGILPAAPQKVPVASLDVAGKKAMTLPNMNGTLQSLPSLYNMGQGLFGDVASTTRRTFTPTLNTYQDLSGPQRQASTVAMKQAIGNSRAYSGGNAGNIRANSTQAYAENAQRQAIIDSQEAGRKLATNEQNTALLNDAKLRNNSMNDRADDIDAQRQGRKSDLLVAGLEGISALASNNQLMTNQKAAQDASINELGNSFKNFERVNGKWVIKKARNGIKKIKK